MTKANQFYKCAICGNVVEVIEPHEGELVCCGQPMNLLEEKTAKQEGREKHVPIINMENGVLTVKVGSTPHPMEEKHYIELIQLLRDGKVFVEKKLNPSDKPQAIFCCIKNSAGISARALCNIHGLWVS
jgi:superoxide reductase